MGLFAKGAKKRDGQIKALRDHPEEPHHILSDRAALAKIRKDRWEKLISSFRDQPDEFYQWAERMRAVNDGKDAHVWENKVDWIIALYIVRYGENEAFWPDSLTADDLVRATRWETGDVPEAVKARREV